MNIINDKHHRKKINILSCFLTARSSLKEFDFGNSNQLNLMLLDKILNGTLEISSKTINSFSG